MVRLPVQVRGDAYSASNTVAAAPPAHRRRRAVRAGRPARFPGRPPRARGCRRRRGSARRRRCAAARASLSRPKLASSTSKLTRAPTCVNRAPSKSKPSAPRGAGVDAGRIGQPDEARLRVDEAADQPGAGQAVDPGPRARGPAFALELARDPAARCRGRPAAGGSPFEKRASSAWRNVLQLGLRLLGGGAGVVVDAPQCLQGLGHARRRRRASVSPSAGRVRPAVLVAVSRHCA